MSGRETPSIGTTPAVLSRFSGFGRWVSRRWSLLCCWNGVRIPWVFVPFRCFSDFVIKGCLSFWWVKSSALAITNWRITLLLFSSCYQSVISVSCQRRPLIDKKYAVCVYHLPSFLTNVVVLLMLLESLRDCACTRVCMLDCFCRHGNGICLFIILPPPPTPTCYR